MRPAERSAPRRATAALLPASSGVTSATDSARSTRSKHGSQRRLVELQAELALPALEHVRRRAKAGAGVDERRPAEPAAERQQDRRRPERRRLPAVAVEPREHLGRAGAELVGVVARALLEHDHARAALGELGRDDGAAGARADHADVGLERARSRPSLLAAQRAAAGDDGVGVPAERARRRAGSS